MRVTCGLIAAMMVTLIAPPLSAANEDGSAVAVLQGGRTLVPVRTVAEWLGADVQWDTQERQIVITNEAMTLRLQPDSTEAFMNAEPIVLDEPPMILAGVTYVPARFVAEAFGADASCPEGRCLTLTLADEDRRMDLRVAVRDGDWLTYRGPWFDIDYPAGFRPLGYDHAPGSDEFDEDGMRFLSPDGTVIFYVHSPLWSGDPAWPTVWPGETVLERNSSTEGAGIERKRLRWVTVAAPQDDYTRAWLELQQPELNVKYYLGIRYDSMAAYDRWRDEYARFKDSLVQYAD